MKKITLLFVCCLYMLACKKGNTNNNPTPLLPDQLSDEQIEIIEAAGMDTVSTYQNALFPDGSNMSEWEATNDSGYTYIFSRRTYPASDKKLLFINSLTHAGFELTTKSISTQKNGLAYVWNSKSIAAAYADPSATCKTPLYGLDCSGMIYQMANSSGINLPSGGTHDYAKTTTWNTAFDNSPDFKGLQMSDLIDLAPSDILPGDIIVAPGHHMGMVVDNGSFLGVFNSLGSPSYSCADNSIAKRGPIISPNVKTWLKIPGLFPGGYHVLRVVHKGVPGLTTANISSLKHTSVISGGNITNDGGASITARGICWSNHPNPTLADSITSDGTGVGIFSSNISNLLSYPSYYIRAYATNSNGTSYGNEISFRPLGDSVFTDNRDGQRYPFRHIGSQVWMTRNLNYYIPPVNDTVVSCHYSDNATYGATYGLLYDWDAAKQAVPAGWHLPSSKEYAILYEYLMAVIHIDAWQVDEHVKDSKLWDPSITRGTNISGFSALPAGGRGPVKYESDGRPGYGNLGLGTIWWTSNENDYLAGYSGINVAHVIGGSDLIKKAFSSVRCIRNKD